MFNHVHRSVMLNIPLTLDDRIAVERLAGERDQSLSMVARDALRAKLDSPTADLPRQPNGSLKTGIGVRCTAEEYEAVGRRAAERGYTRGYVGGAEAGRQAIRKFLLEPTTSAAGPATRSLTWKPHLA
jgi:hypothetical protein